MSSKTHCKHGHEFTEANTYVRPSDGARICKECRKRFSQKHRVEHGQVANPGVGYGGVNAAKTHCPQGHEYSEDNTTRTAAGGRLCKACARANSREQNHKRYGTTIEGKRQMLVEQGHACAICTQHLPDLRRAHLDHDHACCGPARACDECRRGLLCRGCNAGLGHFNDDPELLRAASLYLDSHLVGAN